MQQLSPHSVMTCEEPQVHAALSSQDLHSHSKRSTSSRHSNTLYQCTWHRWRLWLLGHYRTESLPTTRHPEHMPHTSLWSCLGLPSLWSHSENPCTPVLFQHQILTQGDTAPCQPPESQKYPVFAHKQPSLFKFEATCNPTGRWFSGPHPKGMLN